MPRYEAKRTALAGLCAAMAIAGCHHSAGSDAGFAAPLGDAGEEPDAARDGGAQDGGAPEDGGALEDGGAQDGGAPGGQNFFASDGGLVCTPGPNPCATAYEAPNACPCGQGGYACVNFQDDPGNCGDCGHTCSDGDVCVVGACAAPPTCGSVANGLLAYYSFDDGTPVTGMPGQIHYGDSSGNGYSATGTDTSPVPGILGRGVGFASATSAIVIDTTANGLMLGFAGSSTFCAWVLPDPVSGAGQPVFQLGTHPSPSHNAAFGSSLLGILAASAPTSAAPGFYGPEHYIGANYTFESVDYSPLTPNVAYEEPNDAYEENGDSATQTYDSSLFGGSAAQPASWNFVCWSNSGVFVNGTMTPIGYTQMQFQNGQMLSNFVPVGLPGPALTSIVLGANQALTGYSRPSLSGTIDEVGIWNRTLSQDEMNDLYAGGAGCRPTVVCPAASTGVNGACVAPTGCADGTREGFTNQQTYPNIAGCSGGWTVPGLASASMCGQAAGNSSDNPQGTGCAAVDLCAVGYHLCTGDDVAANLPPGSPTASVLGPDGYVAASTCGMVSETPGQFFATLNLPPLCVNEGLGGCGTNASVAGAEYANPAPCEPLNVICDATMPASAATNLNAANGVLCCLGAPTSCNEILASGASMGDGLYSIDPDGTGPYQVWCDMTTAGGGWTTFYAGLNGSPNDFAQFDNTAVSCSDPQNNCLRRIPAEAVAAGGNFQILASCGSAVVQFGTLDDGLIAYLANGTRNDWVPLANVTQISANADLSTVSLFWTGGVAQAPGNASYAGDQPVNNGWIIAGSMTAGTSFADSFDGNNSFDQCNGTPDATSVIQLKYRY